MAQSQEDVILEIKVKYEEAVKGIADYTLKLEENKKTVENLKKQLKEGSISNEEYAKSMAATKAQTDYNKKAVQTLNKEIQDNLKYEREATGSINQLRGELSKSTAAYNKMSEAEREAAKGQDMLKTISDTTAKLKELEEAHGDHRRSVGDYEKATRNLKGELKDLIQKLAEMKVAGEDNTEAYRELSQKAAELKDTIGDVNAEINNMASDTSALDGLNQGIQTIVASYGLYKSAMSAAGLENEELEQSVEKLTMVMTALDSLQTIQNALQKESALMKQLDTVWTKAYTVATTAATGAMKLFGVATNTTSTAFKLLRGAIIATGIGVLVVLIVTLIANLDKLTSWFNSSAKAAKEAEKANKAYEAQAQKTADTIKQINNDEKNNTNERANQLRQDVIDLKTKGATAKEIADAEKKAQEEIRNINMNASKEREKQMKDREKTTEQVLKKEKERLAEIARTKGTGNEKYDEQKKKINELTAAYNELTQAIKEEQQVQNDLILQSAEAILKEKEQKAAAYKEYQSTQKERANAEREAIRQAQDSALALLKEGVEKQRQAINQSYDRQIEDLKRKLQQEKNLTAAAREAINQTIQNIEQQRQNELQKLSGEETKKRIENETRLIDLKLQAIKAGSEAEYQLRLQQLAKQQEAELNNLELTEEMKAAIRDKYQKQNDDLEKQKQLNTLNDQKAAVELEWRQRLEALQQGSLEESALKIQQAQTEYDALLSMDAEHKALLYGEGLAAETEYTNAVLDLKEKLRDAETANQEAIKQSTQTQLQAAQAIGQGFEEILNSFAENNETMAGFAKMVALFNIGLNTAEALSAIPSMAAAGDPYTYALRVATAIATVMTNIAKAKQLLSKEKQPKAPKFATGGIVSGPGSASSDSIVANLSSGESILNAPATAMFAPLLSALNQIGGGIPINTVETSQQIIGEEMLARAFARGVEALPAPVVSIEEINSVNARVKILENLSLQ